MIVSGYRYYWREKFRWRLSLHRQLWTINWPQIPFHTISIAAHRVLIAIEHRNSIHTCASDLLCLTAIRRTENSMLIIIIGSNPNSAVE